MNSDEKILENDEKIVRTQSHFYSRRDHNPPYFLSRATISFGLRNKSDKSKMSLTFFIVNGYIKNMLNHSMICLNIMFNKTSFNLGSK